MIETLGGIATLTAWGNARQLDEVLLFLAEDTDATKVELAIGALPISDSESILRHYAGRFEYVGHHAMPVGSNRMLRPTLANLPAVVDVVKSLNMRSYSAHPPANVDEAEFFRWAFAYHSALHKVKCHFAVETMYPTSAANEARHQLSTPMECLRFIDWAHDMDWPQPLVLDVSHLHIGLTSGVWRMGHIDQLVNEYAAHEIHVSCNDGKRDQHRPLEPGTWEHDLAVRKFIGKHPFVVDEGRRRGTVKTTEPNN